MTRERDQQVDRSACGPRGGGYVRHPASGRSCSEALVRACSMELRGCLRWLRRRGRGPGDAPHQSADERDFLRSDRPLRLFDDLRPGGSAREVPDRGWAGVLHGNRRHLHPFRPEETSQPCWSNYDTILGDVASAGQGKCSMDEGDGAEPRRWRGLAPSPLRSRDERQRPASQGGRASQASDRQLHWAAQPLALAKAMPSSSATNSQRYRSVSVKEFS